MKWILALILATLLGALAGWLLFESSLMAISEITIDGASRADVATIIEESGVHEGMPTISADADELTARITAHPWVASADVSIAWPGSISVTVLEHTPVAWVSAGDAWVLAAVDGSVLEVGAEASDGYPTVSVASNVAVPGEVLDPVAIGAIAFVAALTDSYRAGATVTGTPEAVGAVVDGHSVSLGHPVDMAEKAKALEALLATGLTQQAPVNLVSPLRPAVADPGHDNLQAPLDGLVEIPPEPQPTG
jgi:cell division protein FtsQ